MGAKFLKPGKVVILLAGRHAGQKAIIVQTSDGDRQRQYGHALVAGIEKGPQAVTKSMNKAKIENRSKVKTFLKYVNFVHLMPTRYSVNEEKLKKLVTPEAMATLQTRKEARLGVKKAFEATYFKRPKDTPGISFFYQKLRF